jgi:hypothetical protein
MAIDIIATVAQTSSQFLSTVSVGGQQFLGSAVNLLTMFAGAVLHGLMS